MDIGTWLRGLGLEQYEPVFRDNAIDLETLPDLTETDLEKLGVLLGHRKRILRAIDDRRAPQRRRLELWSPPSSPRPRQNGGS